MTVALKKIGHTINDDGSFKSYTDICLIYNIDKRTVNSPFYDKIVRAVSANWKLIKRQYKKEKCLR